MRKILTSFAIVASVALATAAVAQGTGSSGTGQGSMPAGASQGNGSTASGGTSGAAPIGHRQPRVADVPDEKNDINVVDPRDAALDRALRSICRGC